MNSLVMKIYEALKENKMFYDVYTTLNNEIAIEVNWGDWKHDHLRLDWFMQEKFDLSCIRIAITEDDDSDTYSAIHYYKIEA